MEAQDTALTVTRRWQRPLVAVVLATLAVVLQLRLIDRGAVPMDEGHLASAAVRLLDGDLLYRDVHTGIAPGIYHFAAALFAVFGEDLIVTRVAQLAVNLAVALCLWLLAARVVRPHWAALVVPLHLLLVAVSFPVLTMLNYSSVALACALAALLFAQRYQEGGRMADALATGGLLAAAALTKQNYGALAIAALFASLVWNHRDSALGARPITAALAPVVAAGALLAFAVVGYFAARGGLLDLVHGTLLDLGASQLESFDNPIPPIFGEHSEDPLFMFLYTPPTLFNFILHGGTWFDRPVSGFVRELAVRLSYGIPLAVLAAGPPVLFLSRRGWDPRVRREVRTLVVFASLFFLGIFPSAVWSHLAFVVAPVLLVGVVVLERVEHAVVGRWSLASGAFRLAAAAAALACIAGSLALGGAVRSWFPEPLDLPRAKVHVTPHLAALYRGASRFVEDCAAPGEAIFVAPDIPIVYFLTGRRNPTRYDLMIPGNVDGAAIIEHLERDRTRCVVYNPRMYPEFPAFETLFPELDRYLSEHYRQASLITGSNGEWRGLVRAGAPPP